MFIENKFPQTGSMVEWLAPWPLNPKTRVQISVEPAEFFLPAAVFPISCVSSVSSRFQVGLILSQCLSETNFLEEVLWCSG